MQWQFDFPQVSPLLPTELQKLKHYSHPARGSLHSTCCWFVSLWLCTFCVYLYVCVCLCVLLLVSKVVPCAVMLHVLVRRPLVTMTENSYSVLGFKPVTMWLRLVALAICGETRDTRIQLVWWQITFTEHWWGPKYFVSIILNIYYIFFFYNRLVCWLFVLSIKWQKNVENTPHYASFSLTNTQKTKQVNYQIRKDSHSLKNVIFLISSECCAESRKHLHAPTTEWNQKRLHFGDARSRLVPHEDKLHHENHNGYVKCDMDAFQI